MSFIIVTFSCIVCINYETVYYTIQVFFGDGAGYIQVTHKNFICLHCHCFSWLSFCVFLQRMVGLKRLFLFVINYCKLVGKYLNKTDKEHYKL